MMKFCNLFKVDESRLNEAYQQVQEREIRNNRIPVLIIGQDRAGKTSFRKRLLVYSNF